MAVERRGLTAIAAAPFDYDRNSRQDSKPDEQNRPSDFNQGYPRDGVFPESVGNIVQGH
jgi:hypothetical protein